MFRKDPDPMFERMRAVKLFAGCADEELPRVARFTTESTIAPGAVLCRQGTVGRQAFVILEGEAVVTIGHVEVARVGAGSVVGEMAILDGPLRTATVTAVTPVRVLAMSGHELEDLLLAAPHVTRRILASLSGRLRLADHVYADKATITTGAAS